MPDKTETCNICQGSGYIMLPIRRALSYDASSVPIKSEPGHRTFKCPQCKEAQIADERVQTLGVAVLMDEHVSDHASAMMRQQAATELANHMLANDAIRFKTERRASGKLELIGTVATVTQNQIERIEVKERRAGIKYANKVVRRAVEKIAVWGRDIGRTEITKEEAIRFIREAVSEVETNR